jgi:hypothetical protein
MHEEFKKSFKDNELSFATVEEGIKCPKNYLSRFINGPKELPTKWEKRIREFLKGVIVVAKAGIQPKDAEKFFQKAWVPLIEKYCLEEAGIDPEGLIEQHRSLKKKVADMAKAPLRTTTEKEKNNADNKDNWTSLSKTDRLKWLKNNQ